MSSSGLVVFDLDGTLINIESAWKWVHEYLGTYEKAKSTANLYLERKISYQEWAELDVELWHGHPINEIEAEIKKKIDFIPGTYELIKQLKEWNLKTALISGGLSLFTDKAQKELGIDFAYANTLKTDNDNKITLRGDAGI